MRSISKRNYKEVSKELKAKESCPGISWKTSIDNGDGDFDVEIVPLLKLLNNSYWHTVASCAGHPLSYFKGFPKKGYGLEEPYVITIYIHVHKDAIHNFLKIVRKFDDVSRSRFWCELGYRDDYSNLVEENYIPFRIIVYGRTRPARDRLLRLYEEIARKHRSFI